MDGCFLLTWSFYFNLISCQNGGDWFDAYLLSLSAYATMLCTVVYIVVVVAGMSSMPGVQWRDPDLHEVIEFLSNPNSVIKVSLPPQHSSQSFCKQEQEI